VGESLSFVVVKVDLLIVNLMFCHGVIQLAN